MAFFQQLPETGLESTEVARLTMSVELAKNIVDVMTTSLDYYPAKKAEATEGAS